MESTVTPLTGMRVAFLVANEGIEEQELTEPWDAVTRAGGRAELLAPKAGEVQCFRHLDRFTHFFINAFRMKFIRFEHALHFGHALGCHPALAAIRKVELRPPVDFQRSTLASAHKAQALHGKRNREVHSRTFTVEQVFEAARELVHIFRRYPPLRFTPACDRAAKGGRGPKPRADR